MEILEFMSFNPSWFLTLPGILITGGVVLLLIALILLLTSGKKEKENNIEAPMPVDNNLPPVEQTEQNVNMPNYNEEIGTLNIPTMSTEYSVGQGINEPILNTEMINDRVAPVTPSINIEVPTPNNTEINSVENVVPAVDPVAINMSINTTPITNNNETIDTINNNILNSQFTEENIPQITPDINEVNQPIIESTPIVEEKQTVSIYGGVSPISNFKPVEPIKPVIYGGADPLENTAPLPKIETPVIESSILQQEVKVVEPIVKPEIISPAAIVDNGTTPIVTANVTPAINDSEDEIETLDF